MYIPAFNQLDDNKKIDHLIEHYGFAIVISQKDGAILASHLPVLLERKSDGARILRSHMARANPQWQHFIPDNEVLCIFTGPHAYISPSWYQMRHTVPTWNYAVAHVYGRASIVDEIVALRQIVLDTTAKYESRRSQPWRIPLSDCEMDTMLKAVVGFSIAVTRVEGKFKFGQNRSREDRDGMLHGLMSSPDAASQELARFIMAHGDHARAATRPNWP